MFEDDKGYYESNMAEVIFDEYKEKMKSALLDSVKLEMDSIKKENAELRAENAKLNQGVADVSLRELVLLKKEKDFERRLEDDFYKSRFSQKLSKFEEESVLWVKSREFVLIDKCDKCDENREITYTSPFGDTVKQKCKCDKQKVVYSPAKYYLKTLKLYKDKAYSSPRELVFTPKYDSERYDDMYAELKVKFVYEKFVADDIEGIDRMHGEENIAFTNEKACQDYCDWVNSKLTQNGEEVIKSAKSKGV